MDERTRVPHSVEASGEPGSGNVAEGFAARCGERILRCFEIIGSPDSPPLYSRREAFWDGIGTAIVRVAFGAIAPVTCVVVGTYFGWIAQIGPALHLDGTVEVIAIGIVLVTIIGCITWSLYLVWSDADDKWRTLNWLYFTIVAAAAHLGRNPSLLVAAILTCQFALHYSIHAALRARDRRAARERKLDRDRRGGVRSGKAVAKHEGGGLGK